MIFKKMGGGKDDGTGEAEQIVQGNETNLHRAGYAQEALSTARASAWGCSGTASHFQLRPAYNASIKRAWVFLLPLISPR